MEQIKKNMLVIIAVAVVAITVIVYIVLRGQKKPTPSNALPAPQVQVPQVEIQNNPVEKKIPEINPVEKANPFKYKNPLVK